MRILAGTLANTLDRMNPPHTAACTHITFNELMSAQLLLLLLLLGGILVVFDDSLFCASLCEYHSRHAHFHCYLQHFLFAESVI